MEFFIFTCREPDRGRRVAAGQAAEVCPKVVGSSGNADPKLEGG